MSDAASTTELTATVDIRDTRRRAGVAILVGVMVATTVFGLLVNVFFPEGDGGHLTYDTVEATRTFFRTWLTLAAVNLAVGLTAFALAGWLLSPPAVGLRQRSALV